MSSSTGGAPAEAAAAPAPRDPHDTRRRVLAILGGSSGNLVEWYDFYVYAATALYFAPAFFPGDNPTVQLLNTAAIFAVGFLMRPIGGWLFGRIADRHGRRASMLISVLLMCFGSLMIAVLPTYQSIGLAAPALLLVARLLQGLSVGGEYGTSATYMSEVALARHRGFFASFQYVTLIGGQLLALLVVVVLQSLYDTAEIRAWAWRIPFFIGAGTAVIALFLRRALHETSTASERGRDGAGSIALLLKHPRPLLQVIGLTAGGSLSFYAFTTYMQKFLVNTAGFSAATASQTMAAVLFCYMLLQPPLGALSDRIGRRNSLLVFAGGMAVITVPLMGWLAGVQTPVAAFGGILAALFVVSFYTSISGVVKAEMFPAEIRALGVGLGYAIANSLFGGTAEYVALYLKSQGVESAFYWYVAAFALVSLAATLSMKEPRQHGYLRATDED
ncbi:MFS family transporter [Pseudoroseomonas cervicalis]|uniref:Alpha-ketoglutarate permease n=1 Tax=Pseudoroseomonas cervicalis ATCC 49957 TaxID=525371 RepID=D5RQ09_9PROT|nr:MFS family transporter [Pseudoroseomonas cervicalis]EFH10609.1 MFS transporter, metabolite:H+ symporter (MHS) family protein [Pseudoroseomonas cervicalis ATCC 49957]